MLKGRIIPLPSQYKSLEFQEETRDSNIYCHGNETVQPNLEGRTNWKDVKIMIVYFVLCFYITYNVQSMAIMFKKKKILLH